MPSTTAAPRTSRSRGTAATRVTSRSTSPSTTTRSADAPARSRPTFVPPRTRPGARGRVSQHVERREARPAHEAQLFAVDTRRDPRIAEVAAVEKGSARAHEGAGVGKRRVARVPPDVQRADDLDPGAGDAPHELLVPLGGHVRQIVDADGESGARAVSSRRRGPRRADPQRALRRRSPGAPPGTGSGSEA